MKKFLMLAIISIGLFTLTGCGNTKVLTCTMEKDSTYDEIETTGNQVKLTFNKKGDKIEKYSQNMYIIYNSSVSSEDFDSEYNDAKSACDEYKDYTGITCKVTKTGKKISLIIEVNLEKANKEIIEEFSLNEIDDETYDSMKKDAETSGYTCK